MWLGLIDELRKVLVRIAEAAERGADASEAQLVELRAVRAELEKIRQGE